MIFTLCLIAFLGLIVIGGLIFAQFHPNHQAGDEGMPRKK